MNDNNSGDNSSIRPELRQSVIELSNDFRLRFLGNWKISRKYQNFQELLPSAYGLGGARGKGATFQRVNKINCFRSLFVCLLQKCWIYRLIQAPYVHIWALKLHSHFNVGKKLSLLNFVHIIIIFKFKNFSSKEIQYPGTIL